MFMNSPVNVKTVSDLFDLLARQGLNEIDDNNGIKKEGFTKLCYSVGLLIEDVSTILMGALDSHGRVRGDVAHNPIGKVRTLNDPRVEADDARNIVNLLDDFDQDLVKTLA